MPDWKKVAKTMLVSLEAAAREANARQELRQRRGVTTKGPSKSKICLFWNCDVAIRADHILCYNHYGEFEDGLIDECPGCGLAKYEQYPECLKCYNTSARTARTGRTPLKSPANRWYKPEYSEAWEKGDATANRFFVYILKLDGGEFYAGQTRELRERLSEHRDGGTKSTAGRNPKLVWFGMLPTRDAAAAAEVELKKLVDSNPREVRRMVIGFRDLVDELDYS